MKAALTILQPGENGQFSLVDFDGDLDRLLRPVFDGHDFEHLYVRKDGATCDIYIISQRDDEPTMPVNDEATRLLRHMDRIVTGPAVVVEQIKWVE